LKPREYFRPCGRCPRFQEVGGLRRFGAAWTRHACLDQIAGAFLGGDRQGAAGPFCPSRCGSSASVPPA
jgi:hypothetical protein